MLRTEISAHPNLCGNRNAIDDATANEPRCFCDLRLAIEQRGRGVTRHMREQLPNIAAVLV
eukprot:4394365-Lingulodinium_polyedra.AAC.1